MSLKSYLVTVKKGYNASSESEAIERLITDMKSGAVEALATEVCRFCGRPVINGACPDDCR